MRASLAEGANCWNGGEFYGTPQRNSLHLLNEYFTKYPEDADKVVLSIKGGMTGEGFPRGRIDGSPENIKRSIDECLRVLDGKKFLDLFEAARVDPNTPIEVTVGAINEYVKAGKLGGISLSEVNANSIRRAAKVAKISAVEVEFSLWSTDILENGIAEACAELDIPIFAYSPLGRGFLTGAYRKPEDIPADDMRRTMPRFQGEAFYQNIKLVHEIEELGKRKGATPGQIGIAWIRGISTQPGMPVIIPIPGASSEKRVQENSKAVTLTKEEMDEIQEILNNFNVSGDRYNSHGMAMANG
jgi:pyridoxine 4-dehydrogenase